MILTSLKRCFRFTELTDDSASLTARPNATRLKLWIASVSSMVEKYLNRNLELKTHTEYFDYNENALELFIRGFPIKIIGGVYYDSTGQFNGSETQLDASEYTIGANSRSIVLLAPLFKPSTLGKRAIKAYYQGGLASHAVNSTFSISTPSTAFTVGNYVTGQSSSAVGVCQAVSVNGFIVENLSGVFTVSETVIGSATEYGAAISGVSATINSIQSQSLAESNPDIVMAVESQIRFMAKHKDDFENAETNKEGTRRRGRSELEAGSNLQPEALMFLEDYKRLWVGA